METAIDLSALIANQTLDRETIERLKAQDPAEIRAQLNQYLPKERVEAIMRRIAELTAAL
jgi:cytochrome c553